ncbi:MAG: hypothetical protein ACHRXM_20195 [Isosphaerales bacterium]
MSPLVLAFLLAVQAPDSPTRSTLSNDHPQFPIGLAKDMKLLEQVNEAAIKDPLAVAGFMEQAVKRGELLAIPSGTRAKSLSTQKLRGPVFKEIVQVEVSQGTQKGLRGWVCSKSLVSDEEFAALGAAGEGKKAEQAEYRPLYRDPIPGEKAYLAPQPTMFGVVRSLIRLVVADDSAPAVFQEWQGAPESSRDAVVKRLEAKKAIFFTTLNTEVKVQKVFPEQLINRIYPVQVELLSGQFKGKVGWVSVTRVSPVPGKATKPAAVKADRGKEELQATIERRKNRRQRAQSVENSLKAEEQQRRQEQLHAQVQLQTLQREAAVGEAQIANQQAQTQAYQQMARALRQQQLQESYRNGGGVVYGPNGAMTMDEFLRSRNP